MKAAVRAVALAVAALGAAWAMALVVTGGFDVRLFGRTVTAHDPIRPLVLAFGSLLVFVAAGGRLPLLARMGAGVDRAAAADRWIAIGLAVAALVLGLRFGTMAIGGSDSYGYVTQADLWLSGHLKVSQPWVGRAPWPAASWTFAPLAYRPADNANASDLVPTYSPGLPLLMAGAKIVGGTRAMFGVVPVLGAVMVLATFGIGRRLGSSRAGVVAAALVATSPVFLFMVMLPMSDVAASGLWAAALYFWLGPRTGSAAAAGLASSAAILVRPNLFPLAGVLALWYLVQAWRDADGRRHHLLHFAMFSVCALVGVAATAAINAWVYGSPATSGYGRFEAWFAWANVRPNVATYARWFVDSQSSVALLGLLALVAPARRIWPFVSDRGVLAVGALFVLTILGEYFAFMPLDSWWSLRLLLPCWPLVMAGLASLALAGVRTQRPVLVLAGAGLVALLLVRGVVYAADHGAFTSWKDDRRYPAVGALVRASTGEDALVLSLMHSGSLRYYAGRMTMRFDLLAPEWLDRAVAWLTAQGVHPYALLEEWELADVRRRFPGQRTVAEFDAPPVFVYSQPARIYLFDLLRSPDAIAATRVEVETFRGPRFMPPAPPASFAFKE